MGNRDRKRECDNLKNGFPRQAQSYKVTSSNVKLALNDKLLMITMIVPHFPTINESGESNHTFRKCLEPCYKFNIMSNFFGSNE